MDPVDEMLARYPTSMLSHVGIRYVERSDERVVAELDFRPELQQLTGLFHAGALVTLADSTATAAAMRHAHRGHGGPLPPERFPLAVQISSAFLRNAGHGTVRAEARIIHPGRRMVVIETRVTDEDGRLLVVQTSTHLVPG